MNLIPLKSVEFKSERRGPGERSRSDLTATYATHKAKAGDQPGSLTATGLVILWDRESHAVMLILPEAKNDPCVIYSWSDVSRAIPDSFAWLQAEMEAELESETRPAVPHPKPHAGR